MVGALLTVLFGCGSCPAAAPAPGASPPAAAAPLPAPGASPPAPGAALATPGGVLAGACEASTIVPWHGGWLVGDNETGDHLFAYGADLAARPPVPLAQPVEDIEALAPRADGVWVIGSQSTTKKGERRALRERILAPDGSLRAIDLTGCTTCLNARGLAPNAGGLNVEGAAWVGDQLWLGLRAPLDAGKALLLRLDDDARVVEVVRVDLGGNGVRELVSTDTGLYVVAGPVADGDAPHALYRLADPHAAPERLPVTLPPSTEGLAPDPATPGAWLYVTDGDGKNGACKTPATWGRVKAP